MSDFLQSVGGFNPTPMSLSEIQNMKIPGMGEPLNLMQGPTGMYGNTSVPMSSPVVQNAVQGATQGAIAKPEQGMSNSDMMQLAGMAMKGFGNKQAVQPVTQQIIHDNNQFRYAGFQQSPQQQMAQALRNR